MAVAVIGNGALGLFTALELVKQQKTVYLIGPRNVDGSASYAAGLMIALFSEIDCIDFDSPLFKLKMNSYDFIIELWDRVSKNGSTPGFEQYQGSLGTEIVEHPKGATCFEKESFGKLKKIVFEKKNISNARLSSSGGIILPKEKPIDARKLLGHLVKELESRVTFVPTKATKIIEVSDSKIEIQLEKCNPLRVDKAILCCGAFSSGIVRKSYFTDKVNINAFYGVGTGGLITSEHKHIRLPELIGIKRTVNRGGECGHHFVPCDSSIYFGASNFFSKYPVKEVQASSLLELLRGVEAFWGADVIQKLSVKTLTGFRSITDDAIPMIGPIDEKVFLLYGTARDGFTWAPFYSKLAANWSAGKLDKNNEWIDLCSPTRQKRSFLSRDVSLDMYIRNRIAAAEQHSIQFISEAELKSRFLESHKNVPADFTIHPSLVNYFYHEYTHI